MSIHGEIFDIAIIGSGPVGLYGALYAGTRKLRVKIIERQPHAGGRLVTHYPNKTIYDVAGHPQIKATELIDRLVEQCKQQNTEFFFNQKVDRIEADEDGIWSLFTNAGEHRSKTVIVTAGVGAFLPSKLDVPGSKELAGHGVYYNIDDLDKFSDKKVVLVGTGDNALQWAIKLRSVAEKVTLVHRLNRLTAPDDVQEMLDDSGIVIKYPFHELKEIHAEETLQSVTIVNTATGAEETLDADALVLNIGSVVNLNKFKDWGLVVQQNSIAVNEKMETNFAGVYAAGDIVTHPGKLKLISTGAGEIAQAVSSAASWLTEQNREVKRKAAGSSKAFEDGQFFYSGYEATQLAILLETQAFDFYQAAFAHARGKTTKNLFAKMQRNKLDNVKELNENVLPKYSSSQYAQEDLDNTALAYLRSVSAKYLFGGSELAKEALKNAGSDLQNIYTGIRIEEDLKRFHERLSNEKRLVDASERFAGLVKVKAEELELLRSQQAHIMATGVTE